MSEIAGTQVARQYADGLGLEQPQPARNKPPAVVGLTNNHALGADAHMQAFVGVTDRDVRDLLRQTDREADMHAEHRMPKRRLAAVGRIGLPPRAVARVELVGLADVVTYRAGDQDIPIDVHLRI